MEIPDFLSLNEKFNASNMNTKKEPNVIKMSLRNKKRENAIRE